MDQATKDLIRLGVMVGDIGLPLFSEAVRLLNSTGTTLPDLEEIQADIDKYQPRADAIMEKIQQY